MVNTIDFWFDYTCPFSLLTYRVLGDTFGGSSMRVRCHPHERPRARSSEPLTPRHVWDHSVRPLSERVGLTLGDCPPMSAPATRLAFQGYQYARDQGRGRAYSDQVFSAYFSDHLDIEGLPVLTRAAQRAGLDPRRFGEAAVSEHYAARHLAALEETGATVELTPTIIAGTRRIEGVPTSEQIQRLGTGDRLTVEQDEPHLPSFSRAGARG